MQPHVFPLGADPLHVRRIDEHHFDIFRKDDPALKFETDELLVRELGDSAIVTGRLTATRDGAIASQQRFSHYFVKRDGRRQIVAAQGTPVR